MTLWGCLESCVNIAVSKLAVSKLAGYDVILDERAIILTAHSSFQQRVDIIASLCKHLASDFPDLAEYRPAIIKIQEAQRLRNKFAHNSIVIDEESGEVSLSRASARGELKLRIERLELTNLTEASKAIH